jgi:uncharacterized protein
MERYAMQELIRWKNKQDHKPLLIRGVRQVGKNRLMQAFGENEYVQTAYINFETSKLLKMVVCFYTFNIPVNTQHISISFCTFRKS